MVAGRPGLEIIIGTMAGRLHLIDSGGKSVGAFPVPTDSITSQVSDLQELLLLNYQFYRINSS